MKWILSALLMLIAVGVPFGISASQATGAAKCPVLAGNYVLQCEDGQVKISIKQDQCKSITITRDTGYLGKVTREVHTYRVDGTPQPDVRLSAFNTEDNPMLRVHLSTPDSVWGRAGLHTGDQLVALNGQPVASSADFRSRLGQLHIGDTARVQIIRNGVASQVSV